MLFAAMAGTLMGNRTARVRAPTNRPPYNPRHFVFWSSLFALLICVLAVGASRHIFERRISVTTAKGITSSKTSSVGALVYDRFFEQKRVDDFFADNASPKWWNIGKRKAEEKPKAAPATPWESFWNHFDLPDWTAKAPSWAEYCAVFIVDLLRAEVRSREFAKKKEAATIPPEPLKWAGWRIYAIMTFQAKATASDDELAKLCKRFYTEMKADEKKNNGEKTTDFKVVSVQTACDTLEAL